MSDETELEIEIIISERTFARVDDHPRTDAMRSSSSARRTRIFTLTKGEPFADHVGDHPRTDAIIRAEDKDFHVHEDVLSQSDVLVAMLHSPMVEGDTRRITIDDFDADDVNAFLRVLYDRRLILDYATNSSALLSIYRLADKYAVLNMHYLIKAGLPQLRIYGECVCAVLAFSVTYNMPDLVSRCVHASKAIPTRFWEDDNFKQFTRDNPAFVADFMTRVVRHAFE